MTCHTLNLYVKGFDPARKEAIKIAANSVRKKAINPPFFSWKQQEGVLQSRGTVHVRSSGDEDEYCEKLAHLITEANGKPCHILVSIQQVNWNGRTNWFFNGESKTCPSILRTGPTISDFLDQF